MRTRGFSIVARVASTSATCPRPLRNFLVRPHQGVTKNFCRPVTKMKNYTRWVLAAAVIVALGTLFTYFDLPAGWLIAGMLGAAAVALLSRRELNPPAKAMSAAQGLIGVVAVQPLTKLTASDLAHFAGC